MRDAGYFTYVVGKTHLTNAAGSHLTEDLLDELRAWGFVDAVELPDPQMTHVKSAHSDYLRDTTPTGEWDKYERWKDYVDNYVWASPAPDTDPWFLTTEDHLDTFCGNVAADFIRTYADERPLYLQVNFPGPHKPFDPTTEFKDLVDPNDPNMPAPILQQPLPPVAPLTLFWGEEGEKFEDWTEETKWRSLRRDYYAKVALVDAGIGEVIAALKETGLWDEAWIILHSDHGELLADHLLTGKVIPYDPSLRVPLIVRPPGGIAAWVDNGPVDQMDVTRTLLEIGGVDPTGFGERSLLDRVLDGPEGPEAHQSKTVMFENLFVVGLRTDTHKMTYDMSTVPPGPVELYDLVNDPNEITNLVEEPAHAAVLAALVEELTARHPLEMDEDPEGCISEQGTTTPY
jgi:arylsulfatase A-like enzyme